MKIRRKPLTLSSTLTLFLVCSLYLPSAIAGLFSGTEWKVTRGDTLYAIGRAVYPGDSRKQARLRRDIVKLNPAVFANGANNMAVGVVLKLPRYVATSSAQSKVGEVEKVPATVPLVKPEPEAPPKVAPTAKKKVKSAPESQVKKEPPKAKRQSAYSPSASKVNVLASLGYSYGGDKLVYVDGSYDPAGAGGHLRLGYEKIYQFGGGYRIALGLQYGLADGSGGSTTLRDNYLQLAYQHRAIPFVYGIGVVIHKGATLKDESTVDYDSSNGAFVYLENIGSGDLAGWGLSYTSLEIEEKNTSTSFDASRAELYYSWRF